MAENTQAQRHTPLVTCRVDAKYERRATGHCNAETQLADTPLVRMPNMKEGPLEHCNAETQLADTPLVRMPNMKEGSLDTAMLKRS